MVVETAGQPELREQLLAGFEWFSQGGQAIAAEAPDQGEEFLEWLETPQGADEFKFSFETPAEDEQEYEWLLQEGEMTREKEEDEFDEFLRRMVQ